jgi:hypothetical protein
LNFPRVVGANPDDVLTCPTALCEGGQVLEDC